MKPVLLTFDLEYWFESLSIQKYLNNKEEDKVENFVDSLLEKLKQANATATFFVVGKVLDKEPGVIKKIFDNDHEIAVHSLDHKPLWDKNKVEFDRETKTMIDKIERLINKRPIGHRAVNFSLNKNTSWAIDVLKDNGIKYDSSVLPLSVKPNFYKNNKLKEIDVFSGGFYIRAIPWWLFKILLKFKLTKDFVCLYFHPFDFIKKIPQINMPAWKKFIKYYSTKKTWNKLDYILKKYRCISIEKYYYENFVD